MLILGLESTCDESAAALVEGPRKVLANVVKSQINSHEAYGGVVPEIASRLHLAYLPVALRECLQRSGKKLQDIDLIAVSNRPGLLGGLLVGSTLAKTLSYLLKKPLVCVDHLLGHVLAPDLVEDMHYPCIAGVFSGAHSNIYVGQNEQDWTLTTRTRDDAPGEAFDKVAKLLELGYPGGPAIQKFAEPGDEKAYALPLPCPTSLNGDFSFSGLKTAILYQLTGRQGKAAVPKNMWPDLAASFQFTVARGLGKRLLEEAKKHKCSHIYVGGGVAANSRLRQHMTTLSEKENLSVHFPPLQFCVDNGAMIARAGYSLYQAGIRSPLNEDVQCRSNWGKIKS